MRLPAHNAQDAAVSLEPQASSPAAAPADAADPAGTVGPPVEASATEPSTADAPPAAPAPDGGHAPAVLCQESERLCQDAEHHYNVGDFRAARRLLAQARGAIASGDAPEPALAQRMATLQRQLAPDPVALVVGGLTLLLATVIAWLALSH